MKFLAIFFAIFPFFAVLASTQRGKTGGESEVDSTTQNDCYICKHPPSGRRFNVNVCLSTTAKSKKAVGAEEGSSDLKKTWI